MKIVLQPSSESAARIMVLNQVYEAYKNTEEEEISGYLKVHKLETNKSFIEQTREMFCKIFGVDTVGELVKIYGTDALKPENIIATTENAYRKIHTRPLGFDGEVFGELKTTIKEAVALKEL